MKPKKDTKKNRLKTKHESKTKKEDNSEPDLSGTQLKKWREKWVKNIADKQLSEPLEKLLAHGLSFAVSVEKDPVR